MIHVGKTATALPAIIRVPNGHGCRVRPCCAAVIRSVVYIDRCSDLLIPRRLVEKVMSVIGAHDPIPGCEKLRLPWAGDPASLHLWRQRRVLLTLRGRKEGEGLFSPRAPPPARGKQ